MLNLGSKTAALGHVFAVVIISLLSSIKDHTTEERLNWHPTASTISLCHECWAERNSNTYHFPTPGCQAQALAQSQQPSVRPLSTSTRRTIEVCHLQTPFRPRISTPEHRFAPISECSQLRRWSRQSPRQHRLQSVCSITYSW